ncbi:MAG: phage FluMu protein Com, partial [Pirellulaceae bacterium]
MSHLFSITCTTCNKRIAVRDESAIGQIFNCPNCQSMVQIIAPPEYQAQRAQIEQTASSLPATQQSATQQSADPETVEDLAAEFESPSGRRLPRKPATQAEQPGPAQSGIEQIESTQAGPSQAGPSQAGSADLIATNAAPFTTDDPTTDLFGDDADSLSDPHAASSDDAASFTPTGESQKVYGGPVLPTDEWTSSGTKLLQQRALWVVGATAGVGLLVIASFGVRSWLSGFEIAVETPSEHPTELPTNPPTPNENPVVPAPVVAPPEVPEADPIPEVDPTAAPPVIPENPPPEIVPAELNPRTAKPPTAKPPTENPPAEENPSPLPNVITVAPGEIDLNPS